MKQIFSLFFIVIGVSCFGQKDSIPHNIILAKGYYGFPGERLPDVDTLHVIMLVSDTTHQLQHFLLFKAPNGNLSMDTTADFGIANLNAFLKKGYIARKKTSDNYNESFWMENVLIMDENKKPLDKNILIWQSATLKN